MKVTSFKDVETYLYTSVILPLKRLDVPELEFGSPIQGDDGQAWTLYIGSEDPVRRYRRNYQNEEARQTSSYKIMLHAGKSDGGSHIRYQVASYDVKRHTVEMYEQPFKTLNAMPLFGRLHSLFSSNAPFTKIVTEDAAPRPRPQRQRRDVFMDPSEAPGFERFEQEYDGDDDDL